LNFSISLPGFVYSNQHDAIITGESNNGHEIGIGLHTS